MTFWTINIDQELILLQVEREYDSVELALRRSSRAVTRINLLNHWHVHMASEGAKVKLTLTLATSSTHSSSLYAAESRSSGVVKEGISSSSGCQRFLSSRNFLMCRYR